MLGTEFFWCLLKFFASRWFPNLTWVEAIHIHQRPQLKTEKFSGIAYTFRVLTVLKWFIHLIISNYVSTAMLGWFWIAFEVSEGLWRWGKIFRGRALTQLPPGPSVKGPKRVRVVSLFSQGSSEAPCLLSIYWHLF